MQGRHDRHEAVQWHYTDARQQQLGPYSAEAIARLFQFGHIRPDTPVWQDDPDQARPLRECRDAFEIGAGGRIRVIPQAVPAAAEPAPPGDAPAPAVPPAAAEPAATPAPEPAPEPIVPPPPAEPATPPPATGRRWLRPALVLLALLAVIAVALRFAT